MDENSVTSDIHRLIDERLANGVAVHVRWIADAIISERSDIAGGDAPFYRECTFKELTRLAKRAIGKFDVEDETDEQMVLPGFVHLCRAYPITRDDAVVLVPVTLCTDDELMARAAHLDKQAAGCRAHAREIREYVAAREKLAA